MRPEDAAVADGQTTHAALGRERADQEEITKNRHDLDAVSMATRN
jgi:hypothetical protein